MINTLSRIALVVMAGIYAIRATYSLLGSYPFQPLLLLAAAVFGLVLTLFYRFPRERGVWRLSVIALSLIGLSVNLWLFFPHAGETHAPENPIFCAICVGAWAIVAVRAGLAKQLPTSAHYLQ